MIAQLLLDHDDANLDELKDILGDDFETVFLTKVIVSI